MYSYHLLPGDCDCLRISLGKNYLSGNLGSPCKQPLFVHNRVVEETSESHIEMASQRIPCYPVEVEIEVEVELVATKQGCWEVTRSVRELVVLAEVVHFGEPVDTWEPLPDTELW